MPIAKTTDAATQVIGAVDSAATAVLPKTRVSTNDGPGAGGTKKIDVVAPASVAAAAAPAAPARKSAMPMVIGAVALLAAAVGGYVLMNRGGAAGPAQQVAAPAGGDQKKPADLAGAPAVTAPTDGNVQQMKKTVTPGAPLPRIEDKSGTAPSSAPKRSDIDDLRDAVLAETAGPTQWRQILAQLEPIIATATGERLGEAYYVQAHAYGYLDDKAKSCLAANKGKPLLKNAERITALSDVAKSMCP
jgi:hypothetical protein